MSKNDQNFKKQGKNIDKNIEKPSKMSKNLVSKLSKKRQKC